jgi:Phosphate-selective porin O and P
MKNIRNRKSSLSQLKLTLFIASVMIISICLHTQVMAQPTIKVNGYTQATMIKDYDNKAFVFGFERVRLGAKGALNEVMDYKLLVDFMNTTKSVDNDGDSQGIIKYAMLTFKAYQNWNISVGKFKTPIGMEWNTPASKLDFIKRGLGQSLIFHFDTGIMVHSSNISESGFGLAAGVFNAGPNKANDVGNPAEGQDYTATGRISYEMDKMLYAEAFVGSALTSVDSQKTVNVYGLAAKLNVIEKLQLKGEYLTRTDKQNAASDGADYYVQAGYLIHPMFEPIVKYESLDVTNSAKDQTNYTFGVNIFFNPEKHSESKIQFNYVSSDIKSKGGIQLLFQGAF